MLKPAREMQGNMVLVDGAGFISAQRLALRHRRRKSYGPFPLPQNQPGPRCPTKQNSQHVTGFELLQLFADLRSSQFLAHIEVFCPVVSLQKLA